MSEDLRARLEAFLPQMREANEQLAQNGVAQGFEEGGVDIMFDLNEDEQKDSGDSDSEDSEDSEDSSDSENSGSSEGSSSNGSADQASNDSDRIEIDIPPFPPRPITRNPMLPILTRELDPDTDMITPSEETAETTKFMTRTGNEGVLDRLMNIGASPSTSNENGSPKITII